MQNAKSVFNETEAAEYIGVSPGSLRNSRWEGSATKRPNPPFFKIGRLVRYAKEDLDNWLNQLRTSLRPQTQK